MNDAQLAAFRALVQDVIDNGVSGGVTAQARCREIAALSPFALQEIDRLQRCLATGMESYKKASERWAAAVNSVKDQLALERRECERQSWEIGKLLETVGAMAEENQRLKRGDFTPEEFQNLCHHRDEKPGCTQTNFEIGCTKYQRKLFGGMS